MKIVPLSDKDSFEIAKIHAESLSNDFLPSLGISFLSELYESILKLDLGFGFAAYDKEKVAGFILGTTDMQKMFKNVFLKRAIPLGLKALPAIIKKPAKILNIIETFTYSDKESKTDTKSELIVIAVTEKYRNQNIGTKLCLILDKEFAKRRVNSYKVTVNSNNSAAQRFYFRQGFTPAYKFRLYKKEWSLLIHESINNPSHIQRKRKYC